ncbi:MAG: hypothetical protein RR842_14385 [Gordonibacter sp.]|uniref:hypothetical protein n=1 Tax=Gordonibacter sp. TaxID=1968902 RepID=UPI002FC5AA68
MPLPSPTHEAYREWGGKLSGTAFNASLRAARASVREVMGFNVPEDAEQEAAYLSAVCAAVDVDAAYGASGGIGESMASISIGSFSASAGASELNPYETDMQRVIRRELSGSGLLYAGVG